jgi:L-alanine-DL-glutamate epimerase-like enolase superfamily enzyme
VIVTIVSDEGTRGHGYASATPHMGATREGLMVALEHFQPLLIGRDPLAIEATLMALDDRINGNNQAKAGIDCALHDLNARALDQPLCNLLGGKLRDSVPILRILAIKTPAEMAAQAQTLVDAGYRYLKIKVHGDVEEDVACVAAIRERVGKDVHLTIDANQSYSVKNAIAAINRMAPFNIDLVEQPVPVGDFEGLALVTRTVPITVEADEAAGSLAEVYQLVTRRAVDAVSLKIPKLGGFRNTIAAARLCEQCVQRTARDRAARQPGQLAAAVPQRHRERAEHAAGQSQCRAVGRLSGQGDREPACRPPHRSWHRGVARRELHRRQQHAVSAGLAGPV